MSDAGQCRIVSIGIQSVEDRHFTQALDVIPQNISTARSCINLSEKALFYADFLAWMSNFRGENNAKCEQNNKCGTYLYKMAEKESTRKNRRSNNREEAPTNTWPK